MIKTEWQKKYDGPAFRFLDFVITIVSFFMGAILFAVDIRNKPEIWNVSIKVLGLCFLVTSLYLFTSVVLSWHKKRRILKIPIRFLKAWEIRWNTINKRDVDILDRLRNLENKCFNLLLRDQLPETGGWSQTYIWRDVSDGQRFSCAGTFTGTFISIEALRAREIKINQIPKIDRLEQAIKAISTETGRYRRGTRLTSHGLRRWEYQNLRHTAAATLVWASILGKDDGKDDGWNRKSINYITMMLKFNSDDQNPLDMAMISRCLLAYMKETKDVAVLHSVRLVWDYLYSQSQETFVRQHPRLLWEDLDSKSVVNRAIEQWFTIWLALPLIEFYSVLDKDRCDQIVETIVNFIKDTCSVKTNKLLPLGYSRDSAVNNERGTNADTPTVPFGESIFATAMAVYVCQSLTYFASPKWQSELSDYQDDLLNALSTAEVEKHSLNFNGKPTDLQGYLDFAAVILCYSVLGAKRAIDQIHAAAYGSEISSRFKELDVAFDKIDLYHYVNYRPKEKKQCCQPTQ